MHRVLPYALWPWVNIDHADIDPSIDELFDSVSIIPEEHRTLYAMFTLGNVPTPSTDRYGYWKYAQAIRPYLKKSIPFIDERCGTLELSGGNVSILRHGTVREAVKYITSEDFTNYHRPEAWRPFVRDAISIIFERANSNHLWDEPNLGLIAVGVERGCFKFVLQHTKSHGGCDHLTHFAQWVRTAEDLHKMLTDVLKTYPFYPYPTLSPFGVDKWVNSLMRRAAIYRHRNLLDKVNMTQLTVELNCFNAMAEHQLEELAKRGRGFSRR